jgi:hypothetical protein
MTGRGNRRSSPRLCPRQFDPISHRSLGLCTLDSMNAGVPGQDKWLLWHGNQHRALETIGLFEDDVGALEVDYPNLGKFAHAAHEFATYITSNTRSRINYGERYRAGERISSCLAESTVNAVISKRFAKRQRMQWTPRGAHLLLQTRTRALDGTLRPHVGQR